MCIEIIDALEATQNHLLEQYGTMIALRECLEDDDELVTEYFKGESVEEMRKFRATLELSCRALIQTYRVSYQ